MAILSPGTTVYSNVIGINVVASPPAPSLVVALVRSQYTDTENVQLNISGNPMLDPVEIQFSTDSTFTNIVKRMTFASNSTVIIGKIPVGSYYIRGALTQ